VALPWLYVLAAGWTSTAARPGSSRRSAIAAVLVGVIVICSSEVITKMVLHQPERAEELGAVAGVACLGAILGWVLGGRAAGMVGLTRLSGLQRGRPLVQLALGFAVGQLGVLGVVLAYTLVVAALWLACLAVSLFFFARTLWRAVFGRPARRYQVRKDTLGGLGPEKVEEYEDGELRRTATTETDWLGRKRTVHRAPDGEVIQVDVEKRSWLGEAWVEQLDGDGSKVGET